MNRHRIDDYIKPYLGEMLLRDITTCILDEYYPSTNETVRGLLEFLLFQKEEGIIMQADLFSEYPDVVTVEHLMTMLHIGRNAAYSLIQSGKIKTERIGRRYIIPKKSVISYVQSIQ